MEEDEHVFEDVNELLQVDDGSMEDLTQVQYELRRHQRCAAHTLNLVASTDIDSNILILIFKICNYNKLHHMT